MTRTTMTTTEFTSNIAWRRVDDEIVILELESSVYYSLNPVAARIWELLAEKNDVEQIVKKIAEEWNVEDNTVRRDLSAFLKSVRIAKLVPAQ